MAMVDVWLYYWSTQLVVINDWMCGGWSDSTYARELQPLGLTGVLGMLDGSPMAETIQEITKAVIAAWRGALRWIGWDNRLALTTPLWVGM